MFEAANSDEALEQAHLAINFKNWRASASVIDAVTVGAVLGGAPFGLAAWGGVDRRAEAVKGHVADPAIFAVTKTNARPAEAVGVTALIETPNGGHAKVFHAAVLHASGISVAKHGASTPLLLD